jgi:hypothetical protein
MAAKGRSLGGLPRPLANLRLWAPLLVVAIAVGAISAAAQAGVPAVASVPENSPLGLARNPAPTPVGVERLQAPESLLESAFGYGQSASGSPFSTRGPTTLEMGQSREKGDRMKDGTASEAEQQFEEIDRAQRKSREGKGDTIIESTEKSRQRADQRIDRIKNLDDALDEFPED